MDIKRLKQLKESNTDYFMSLMGTFDKYNPIKLADMLLKHPEAEEFIWDYINRNISNPAYRDEFETELRKRKGDKRLEALAQTNSIINS